MCGCVKVTGLLSQGRGEGNEWVTAFLVSYSLDAYHWLYISDQYGNQRVNTVTHCNLHSADGQSFIWVNRPL